MRKGKLVGLKTLPQITLVDENAKLKVVEMEALVLEPVSDFTGNLGAYHHLKSYLNQPIEYLPSKRSQHRCKLIDARGQDIGLLLVTAGLAVLDEQQLANTVVYSPQEVQRLRIAQLNAKNYAQEVITNCVRQNQLLRDVEKLLGGLDGEFTLENIKGQIVVSKGTIYLPVTLLHLNLNINSLDEEQL